MKVCQYCLNKIPNSENIPKDIICFCNSICIFMWFEGDQMLEKKK